MSGPYLWQVEDESIVPRRLNPSIAGRDENFADFVKASDHYVSAGSNGEKFLENEVKRYSDAINAQKSSGNFTAVSPSINPSTADKVRLDNILRTNRGPDNEVVFFEEQHKAFLDPATRCSTCLIARPYVKGIQGHPSIKTTRDVAPVAYATVEGFGMYFRGSAELNDSANVGTYPSEKDPSVNVSTLSAHICNNKDCLNQYHFKMGTHKENQVVRVLETEGKKRVGANTSRFFAKHNEDNIKAIARWGEYQTRYSDNPVLQNLGPIDLANIFKISANSSASKTTLPYNILQKAIISVKTEADAKSDSERRAYLEDRTNMPDFYIPLDVVNSMTYERNAKGEISKRYFNLKKRESDGTIGIEKKQSMRSVLKEIGPRKAFVPALAEHNDIVYQEQLASLSPPTLSRPVSPVVLAPDDDIFNKISEEISKAPVPERATVMSTQETAQTMRSIPQVGRDLSKRDMRNIRRVGQTTSGIQILSLAQMNKFR